MKGQAHAEVDLAVAAVSDGERPRHRATAPRDDDELLKLPEVGRWLGVSTGTVYRLVRSDRPLPVRRLGSVMRVRVGDLRAWVRQTPQVGV